MYAVMFVQQLHVSQVTITCGSFLEQNLDMAEEESNEIPIKQVHRLGKIREDNKPRPIIAKFSFHKDKEHILSSARTLAGTNYGISQDFPREIVEIRKGLVKVMKEGRKEEGARHKTGLQ